MEVLVTPKLSQLCFLGGKSDCYLAYKVKYQSLLPPNNRILNISVVTVKRNYKILALNNNKYIHIENHYTIEELISAKFTEVC